MQAKGLECVPHAVSQSCWFYHVPSPCVSHVLGVVSWIVPPTKKIMFKSSPPGPVNGNLFGNGIFADGLKLRWHPIGLGWALTPMADVFITETRGRFLKQTQCRQVRDWSDEDPSQEAPGWPGVHRSEGDEGGIPPRGLGRACVPADTLVLNIQPPELWESTFLLF